MSPASAQTFGDCHSTLTFLRVVFMLLPNWVRGVLPAIISRYNTVAWAEKGERHVMVAAASLFGSAGSALTFEHQRKTYL